MKRLSPLLVAAGLLIFPAAASAQPHWMRNHATHLPQCEHKSHPIRCSIKHWVHVTRESQRVIAKPHLSAYFGAYKHARSVAEQVRIRHRWHERATHWRHISRLDVQHMILYLWRRTLDGPLFVSIARCESGLRPDAYNPSSATGVFQILGGPFDPWLNGRLAYRMYQSRGTEPWVASAGCWGG